MEFSLHLNRHTQMNDSRETQIGDHVRFAAADVFLPGPGGGSSISGDAAELDGTVIEFSDSGSKPRAFAVVEVVRRQMMVVPVDKLQSI
ncbi:MAG TPA: hypothetical protein VG456_02840 [Candidatus Sulfopaludibacter sp.]|nr:hypothetical protein [Candidatus Sulfopaludibacter sp.]